MASHVCIAFLGFFFIFSNAMQTIEAKDLGFYYFVLMWPGSYCKQSKAGCCVPKTGEPKEDFFVQSLLPYSIDGTLLTKCSNTTFNIDDISDLEDDLKSYWPNIKCPSSKSSNLWKNAWKTYGVCSGLSEYKYFEKALNLRSKVDLLSIFKENDIIATNAVDYELTELSDAIYNGIGTKAAIRCSTNLSNEYQVYQIYMCVDTDAETIITCPVLPNFTCSTQVKFGPFTYDMLNTTKLTANPINMVVPE